MRQIMAACARGGFIVVDADLRDRFAVAAATAKRVRLPSMSEEQFGRRMREDAELSNHRRGRLHRAPRTNQDPEIEQVIAAAAAAENLFLAAPDLGYGRDVENRRGCLRCRGQSRRSDWAPWITSWASCIWGRG